MSKIQLACSIWPQKAVLQTCYNRNICLGPTLLTSNSVGNLLLSVIATNCYAVVAYLFIEKNIEFVTPTWADFSPFRCNNWNKVCRFEKILSWKFVANLQKSIANITFNEVLAYFPLKKRSEILLELPCPSVRSFWLYWDLAYGSMILSTLL